MGDAKKRRVKVIGVAIVGASLGLFGTTASFAAQRTFVDATGLDTNACTIAAPCRSFARAISQTLNGGEIVVLGSAGYGPVSISQSVSIVASAGIYAGITVFPGFNGVDINGADIVVTLKGLSISGQGGGIGISFVQGARLAIEACEVSGMAGDGISATAYSSKVSITDTVVRLNGSNGVSITGGVQASILRTRVEFNAIDGIAVSDGARVSVADSVAAGNTMGIRAQTTNVTMTELAVDRLEANGNAGAGVIVVGGLVAGGKTVGHVTRSNLSQNGNAGLEVCCPMQSGSATASLSDSLVSNNGIGGVTFLASDASWVLTLSGNRIVDSTVYGISNYNSSGTLYTRQDNTLSGNVMPTIGTITPLPGT